jgi:xanthine dehydrogenase/oxidase
VVDYVDKEDMPSPRANRWGAPKFEEMFLAEDMIYSTGQPIAMILATSAGKAAEGARAVEIEYEELPAIFSIEEAIEKESFFDFARAIKKGDPEDAFKKSDYVFTGTARMGGQEHFYLETNACVAIPKPEDGEMEIFSSTQNPNEA